ncbi:50S ribosomal protein L23 [Candidatus Peregrinibacteria bacterium]|nr:50S ribosomal protein L23 [Candidatus Peregrinibacteria bacterium]
MKSINPIIRTLMTEKASQQQAKGQYIFQVSKDATKIDVKNAIREIYGVEADKVRIMITPKKERLLARGRVWTKRPVIKKALVSIKDKKTIDPNKIKESKKK